MLKRHPLLYRVFILLLLCGGCALASAENFPLPDSLKPNVEFWKRVYTEIDGKHGFMHDSRNLALVYETVSIPSNSSRRQRKRITAAARDRIKKQLNRVAGKSTSQLQGDDLRVRKMFSARASARDIRAAGHNVRFQLGQADKFEQAIRRSGYYTRYIKDRFKAAGMPTALAALPFVESSFNVRANSHVGASGIWQFMPSTGRRFMKVNHIIDERYDPYRATDAAVRLLQYNYSILKSWPLALTAYNHGVGGMRRAIRKTGTSDMGVIVKKYRSRSFGFASRNFYSEFLAALEVSSKPEQYFPGIKPYATQELVRFELDHYVPARELARALNIELNELRQHNLALREAVWDGEKYLPARYELRLPKHLLAGQLDERLAGLPLNTRFDAQVPDKTYRIRRGDSLSRIASLYRIRVSDLVMMNNLRSRHRIRAGQVLFLPQKGRLVAQVKPVINKPAPLVVAAVEPEKASDAPDKALLKTQPDVSASATEPADVQVIAEPLIEDEIIASAQQIAATDPAEYSVRKDNTIEVQAAGNAGPLRRLVIR